MSDNLKVAVVGCGYLPNPAVLGGAVETLVDYVIDENETAGQLDLTVFSIYDNRAQEKASDYRKTSFCYIGVPGIIKAADRLIYFVFKDILKKSNAISYRYILQRLSFIHGVARELKEIDFDRVVFENHPTLLLSLKEHGNLNKYSGKVIYHMHNEINSLYGCSKEFSSCWRIVGVSDYVNGVIKANYSSLVSDDQLRVLRNKVDTEQLDKAASDGSRNRIRTMLGISDDETMILFTGRICPDKGVLELVQSFAEAKLEASKLVIVGGYYFDSGLKTEYEDKVREAAAPMGDKVVFTGYVKHDSIPQYYAAADLVCVPSIWDDPAPLAVIEAISAGKKLIATQSGGIPEYASYGDAVIVPRGPEIVQNLASALRGAVAQTIGVSRKPSSWCRRGFYDDFVRLVSTGEVL